MVIFHQRSYESLFCFLSDRAYLVLRGLTRRNIGPCVISQSLGACAFLKMIFQLDDALVGALYLFLNGGALLSILAYFLSIGVGGCFAGLFMLLSGTFLVSVVAFARYYWTYRLLLLFMPRLGVRFFFFARFWLAWGYGISFAVSSSTQSMGDQNILLVGSYTNKLAQFVLDLLENPKAIVRFVKFQGSLSLSIVWWSLWLFWHRRLSH